MSEPKEIYADANDPGLSFILPSPDYNKGGLVREAALGHFGTIVGRGGAGKSILALQLVTDLLAKANARLGSLERARPHAAFYFSLEASPKELRSQIGQFSWGKQYSEEGWDPKTEGSRASADNEYSKGLYLVSVPAPVDSLNVLNLKIRQTVAGELKRVRSLQAIIIDPMGAIDAADDIRANLIQLKELAEVHRTFVFLLTEKFAFEKYTAIEHYSQSIIHLEHDPGQQQHRRLYVQKARGQSFRSGYHYFELHQPQGHAPSGGLSRGIRVFPSIAAQSAYAHERLLTTVKATETGVAFLRGESEKPFPSSGPIEPGSAVFLMGPPGTFKEHICSEFAAAAAATGHATIYVSFKADLEAIMKAKGGSGAIDISSTPDRPPKLEPATYFFDARSPLLTPEEILFKVRTYITPGKAPGEQDASFKRAVIWGLRRLYDFPNFREGRVIQFLEALVTMLKAQNITTLLVDWPDQKVASTVPIVDLCQYIFLTRVCFTEGSPETIDTKNELRRSLVQKLWSDRPKQVALLRAQRTREGVHHDEGAIFKQKKESGGMKIQRFSLNEILDEADAANTFEELWLNAGIQWEVDLSLLS